MLGQGIELKLLHNYTHSVWKHPDGWQKSELIKVRDKVENQVKNNNTPQNTRVYLARLWSDGFQPYNVFTQSSSPFQLFTVTMAHVEKYLERRTEVLYVFMRGFIHLHCLMPTNAPTSGNTCILNLGMENISAEEYMSLSLE